MTNQEILEKAITKAIAGGWDGQDLNDMNVQSDFDDFQGGYCTWPTIIFNPAFAKSIWGEETWSIDPTGWHLQSEALPKEEQAWYLPAYHYHLQQMVIADDPIKYLGEHLDR